MVCHEPCVKVTIAEALTAVWCLVLVPVYSALAYFCRKVLENDGKFFDSTEPEALSCRHAHTTQKPLWRVM